MNNSLIIFARQPELGMVKTRLAREIGEKKALEIYKQLLKKTIETANEVEVLVKKYWSKTTNSKLDSIQEGADLGERMFNALVAEYNSNKLCLIGTDSPALSKTIVEHAFRALDKNDIVFGPSIDGGYYLVGIKSVPPKELFLNKRWSHQHVLKDALGVCKKLNLKIELLPPLLDIDTLDDYQVWQDSL